jgi:NitT/TauT family transport system substrate-binding protein
MAIKGAAVAAVGMPNIIRAQEKSKRSVILLSDFLIQGSNAGLAVAKERGFYADAGIDVTLNQGKGSVATAQIVASKAADFGFADGYVVANGLAKGMNLTVVGGIYRKLPTAVVVLEDSNIRTPKDLIGRSIGIPAASAQFQQWPAFERGAGLGANQVRVVNVELAGLAAALSSGRVEAIAGFAQGLVPSIEYRTKKKTRQFWYADYGLTAVSNGVIIHPDMLRDPDLVGDFVRATVKGFLYGRQNPDELVQIVKKYQESSQAEITLREAQISWNTWVTPATANQPLGWMADSDWAATVDTLKQYGGIYGPLDPKGIFTNEFVPTGPEFIPPQII